MVDLKQGHWSVTTQIQITALPLAGSVILRQLLKLLFFCIVISEIRVIIPAPTLQGSCKTS